MYKQTSAKNSLSAVYKPFVIYTRLNMVFVRHITTEKMEKWTGIGLYNDIWNLRPVVIPENIGKKRLCILSVPEIWAHCLSMARSRPSEPACSCVENPMFQCAQQSSSIWKWGLVYGKVVSSIWEVEIAHGKSYMHCSHLPRSYLFLSSC